MDVDWPLAGAAASRARAVARAALGSLTRGKVPVLVSSGDEIPITTPPRRPFFTSRSLAAYLVISERSVREMLRDGRMPSYKIEGAGRIDAGDVDRYLAAHREESAAGSALGARPPASGAGVDP
jgi:excisionase family DNA binding protein